MKQKNFRRELVLVKKAREITDKIIELTKNKSCGEERKFWWGLSGDFFSHNVDCDKYSGVMRGNIKSPLDDDSYHVKLGTLICDLLAARNIKAEIRKKYRISEVKTVLTSDYDIYKFSNVIVEIGLDVYVD